MRYPRVEIQWEDIWTNPGWSDPNESMEPAIINQVGYVLRKTRTHLVLVSSYDDQHVGDMTNIPLSVVRKVKRI